VTRYTSVALYLGSVLALGALAVRRWTESIPAPSGRHLAIQPLRVTVSDSLAQQLDSAEDNLVGDDPFRLANEPAAVRYDPRFDVSASASGVTAPVIRPSMTLKAIVGGPPWQAVIDGIPGQPPGTIARAGSEFGKLRVRSVTRDSVIIQGPDTAWSLGFRGQP
jgi:hypothetical protein